MSNFWLPSSNPSLTPVTVTLWGTSQLDGLNVREEVETVPSSVSCETMLNTTFEAGFLFNTTLKESVIPASLTTVELFGS